VEGTSASSTPSRGRRLALGTIALVIVAGAYASTTGAQPATDPIVATIVSLDDVGAVRSLPTAATPAISDTGGVVVFDTVEPATGADGDVASTATRHVWIRDRIGGTSRAVTEPNSVAPGVSGNGCIVAFTVLADADATLTVVDRCAAPIEFPLPVGDVVDRFPIEPGVVDSIGAPSLSFDGAVVVWSTGREIRRYERPRSGGPHVRTHTFDEVAEGAADIVTGARVDASADGRTIVFVAGPGDLAFRPGPANVYVWTPSSPQLDPEALSVTASGTPAESDSTSPTVTADGTYVVFQSAAVDLAAVDSATVATPFVVGVDLVGRVARVLVDDATDPTLSGDGNHVAYRQGGAVRVLSSDGVSTTDHGIDELVAANPTGGVAISQLGRWLVFASAADLATASADAPAANEPPVSASPVAWAVDRRSSSPDVVDTTTTSTTTTTTVAPTVPSEPTVPSVPVVENPPTVPVTTLVPTVVVSRFPTVDGRFPSVQFPSTPRRTVSTSSSDRRGGVTFDPAAGIEVTAFATPVTFEPTVVDAGRRTAAVTLTNPTAAGLRVTAVAVDVPDVFTIVGDGCTGTVVAAGATCTVSVEFAPITLGRAAGAVVFGLGEDANVTASLDGEGVPEPTLDLVPSVAGAGQTVTLFGAGFPAGSTVELSQPGSSTLEPIVIDADGTFAHVIVVLPNTPTGPSALRIDGQPDVFDDVTASLLVSSRGAASGDAALRGGATFGR
jgi:hypothetical protein